MSADNPVQQAEAIPLHAVFEVEGGISLRGDVEISGSKNATLPILAASILAEGQTCLQNIPRILAVDAMIAIMRRLGIHCSPQHNSLSLSVPHLDDELEVPSELSLDTRGAVYCLALAVSLGRRARLGVPGGCSFAPRPIDFHIDALRQLGAKIETDPGYFLVLPAQLRGATIVLPFPGITLTCSVLIAAARALGNTYILNASQAPEVVDLCGYLSGMGARLTGIGTSRLSIEGTPFLHPSTHRISPDRSEAVTFMIASAITQGDVLLRSCNPEDFEAATSLLVDSGVEVEWLNEGVRVAAPKPLNSFRVGTGPYPAFCTDWQPLVTALAAFCQGSSIITESFYKTRSTHVGPLQALGADIQQRGQSCIVTGPSRLRATEVVATDIRCGAALILAALGAEGSTRIQGAEHVDRGYEWIERKLMSLCARIARVSA